MGTTCTGCVARGQRLQVCRQQCIELCRPRELGSTCTQMAQASLHERSLQMIEAMTGNSSR